MYVKYSVNILVHHEVWMVRNSKTTKRREAPKKYVNVISSEYSKPETPRNISFLPHFLRHVKGLSQVTHIFDGKFSFLTPRGI